MALLLCYLFMWYSWLQASLTLCFKENNFAILNNMVCKIWSSKSDNRRPDRSNSSHIKTERFTSLKASTLQFDYEYYLRVIWLYFTVREYWSYFRVLSAFWLWNGIRKYYWFYTDLTPIGREWSRYSIIYRFENAVSNTKWLKLSVQQMRWRLNCLHGWIRCSLELASSGGGGGKGKGEKDWELATASHFLYYVLLPYFCVPLPPDSRPPLYYPRLQV